MQNLEALSDRRFYVYRHLKATDKTVFYIGKGSGARAKSASGRNRHWHNIVKKHGYLVEIAQDCLTNQEACDLEIALIAPLRQQLCNIASGGQAGLTGMPLKDEHKNKLRIAKLGKKQKPEHAARSASAKLGIRQPRDAVERTAASKRKQVINNLGEIFPSATAAARAMAKRLGVSASQGNLSMCCNGFRDVAYGYNWSYDTTKPPASPPEVTARMKSMKCDNGMIFKSSMDATRWVKSWRGASNNQRITACARGESPTAYGHKWDYI